MSWVQVRNAMDAVHLSLPARSHLSMHRQKHYKIILYLYLKAYSNF